MPLRWSWRWPFLRRDEPEPPPRPPRSLNRLVLDVAEYQDDADHDELFRRLAGATVYAPAGPELACVTLGGLRFVTLYVNGNDPRLGEGEPVALSFAEALQRVEQTPDVSGAFFYSDRSAYVGVPAGEFDRLRSAYL